MSQHQQNARALEDILIAARKHPQSNVAKLIHTVHEEPTQRNICLLLVELSKNKEFYTDFSVQLGYYLNLFQQQPCGADVLNQAGLLLLASADIYARRVDYVQELVQILNASLSKADKEIEETKRNAENEEQQQSNANATPEQPRRINRKRLVDVHSDPFEVDLQPKKLKILTKEKRNVCNKIETKAKFNYRSAYNEDHIHPAMYLLSTIVDLDNEADVESKKNFQTFTNRLEHRYCTLVPDVNFRLHFVVKDYLEEEGERMREQTGQDIPETQREWPPISEEYLQNLISLENQILKEKDLDNGYDDSNVNDMCNGQYDDETGLDISRQLLDNCSKQQNQTLNMEQMFNDLKQNTELNSSMLNTNQLASDSGCIISNSTLTNESTIVNSLDISGNSSHNDSGIGDSVTSLCTLDATATSDCTINSVTQSNMETTATSVENSNVNSENTDPNATTTPKDTTKTEECKINLNEIRVTLPHLAENENGVLFTELGLQDQRMLSPTVLAIDILPQVPNKEHLTIMLDDELKELLDVNDDDNIATGNNIFELPSALLPAIQPLKINILKIHEKHFKRRTLFRLCAEFDIYMKARNCKRKRYPEPKTEAARCMSRQLKLFKAYQQRHELINFKFSPARSDIEFCGFDNSHLENAASASDKLETMSLIFDEDFCGFKESEIDCFDMNNVPSALGISETAPDDNTTTAVPLSNVESPKESVTTKTEKSITLDNVININATPNNLPETAPCNVTQLEDSDATADCNNHSEDTEFPLDTSKKSSIQIWHEGLRSVLAGSSERHHFNIFDLGTNILEVVQAHNNEATLSDVMADKDMSFCPRYFLSLLILATHNNIELNVMNKSEDKPCEWSDVKFGLLSTKRHALAPEDDICIVKNVDKSKNSTNTIIPRRQVVNKPIARNALSLETPTIAMGSSVLLTPPETPPETPPSLSRSRAIPMATHLHTAATPPSQAFNKTTSATQESLTANSCNVVAKHSRKRLASSDEFNVNLNTFRIVQPIEQIPIQNDEQDSGFCSNECRSAL